MDKGKVDYRSTHAGWIASCSIILLRRGWRPANPARVLTRVLGKRVVRGGRHRPAGNIAPRASGQVDIDCTPGRRSRKARHARSPSGIDRGLRVAQVIAAPLFWVLSAIQKWVNNGVWRSSS